MTGPADGGSSPLKADVEIAAGANPADVDPLRKVAPFDELDGETFEILRPYFREVTYKPGQEMTREGQGRGAFFVILKGKVSISRALNERQRLVLGQLEANSIYGERSILSDQPF